MEFRILGPVQAVEDGRTVPIASSRQRALLALLIVHANEPISADRIADELWGDSPPASGAKAVAFHVSRLRRALSLAPGDGDERIALATEAGGYVLHVPLEAIDAVAAEHLGKEGEGLLETDPAAARERLTAALALWRGEPLSDLAFEPFAQAEIDRLSELRLRLLEDRIEADLALGRHGALVAELRELVAANPYRERLRGQLMLTLFRCGRQAEALRSYQDGRRLLVEELGIDPSPELQQLERAILRQDAALARGRAVPAVRNPFKGLRPFDEQDAADFFGREALIDRLVERLGEVERGERLLTLVGSSGSGKSSVVRAGLIPALRRGALPGSQQWLVTTMVPGSRPFDGLAAALERIGSTATRPDTLRPGNALADVINRLVPAGRLVLVIDQLEELFWRVADAGGRKDFVRAIATALKAPAGRLVVVMTLRADALDRALSMPLLAEAVRSGLEVVPRLTRDELTRAITKPAESVGVELEEGLVPRIVSDVEDRPGTLPLLQYALTEMYDHGDGRRMTCEAHEALGGVTGAVGRRAEEIYHSLDPGARAVAREVFLRLISVHEGAAPAARRVSRDELRSLDDGHGTLERVLYAFGRGRLLAFDRDAISGAATVEPAHEALLTSWGRVGGWIEEEREGLWMRHRLGDAAGEWVAADRDPGYLLVGSRLTLFRDWAAGTTLRLSSEEDAYLAESAAADERRAAMELAQRSKALRLERRASRWLRASVALSAAIALLAVGFAAFVMFQAEAGREQEAIAVSRELAAASVGNLRTDAELSLLLASEAVFATANRGFVTEEALDALHWAFQASSITYPRADAPTAVRSGPEGPRGVYLVPADELVRVAIAATSRSLSREECRTYLHRSECPPPQVGDLSALALYREEGISPVEGMASAGLAGTRIRIALELPAGVDLAFNEFAADTGIVVEVVPLDPARTLMSEAAPDVDVLLTPRSGTVLDLARGRRITDLASVLDVAALRASRGSAVLDPWTAELDEAGAAELYGAPYLASAGSLVWYSPVPFEAAGYEVPRSWDELVALTARMRADGAAAPWCLGLKDGNLVGGNGADWIEDLVLLGAGPSIYTEWGTGEVPFRVREILDWYRAFGVVALQDGNVLGGAAAALGTPASIAGLPLTTDPPRCWLLHGASTAAAAWPAEAARLDVFPLPAPDGANDGRLRGRVYGLAVVSDRPEVRALVEHLLSDDVVQEWTRLLAPQGLYPLASVDASALTPGPTRTAAVHLAAALRDDTFHPDASDTMPSVVGSWAFPDSVARYMQAPGPLWDGLGDLVIGVDRAWPDAWP